MLTSKQRAYLRGLANELTAIINVGKSGVTPELTAAIDEALEARELVKIGVLTNSMLDVKDAAETVAGRTRSQVVSVTGGKVVLYRAPNPNLRVKPIITLPK